jgi:hypothetical protein
LNHRPSLPRALRPLYPLAMLAMIAGCQGAVAPSTPSTQPPPATLAPSTSPSASLAPPAAVAPLPQAMWGDWHASGVAIDGVAPAQLVRLSLDWKDGLHGWIQLDGDGHGRQVLNFTPIAGASAGEIQLRSDPGGTGCKAGDVGVYAWHRSADGLFLSFKLVGDACATRAAAITRTWVHSLSAVNDGGLGVIPMQPWIRVAMPKVWLAASGGTDAADIHTFNDADPFKSLVVVIDPMGFQAPCATDRKPFAISHSVAAYEAYLRTLPGLKIAASPTKLDGIAGRRFEVVAVADPACAGGEAGIFRSRIPTESDAEWSYGAGDRFFNWAIVRDGHLWVVSYDGDGVTVADGQTIIDSMKLMDELPTP